MTLHQTVWDLEERISDLGGNELADLYDLVSRKLRDIGEVPEHDDCQWAHELGETAGDLDRAAGELAALQLAVLKQADALRDSKSKSEVVKAVTDALDTIGKEMWVPTR